MPAHDKRDFEFAKAFDLPIQRVISKDGSDSKINEVDDVYTLDGILLNSDFLNGLNVSDAITKIGEYIEEKGFGKRVQITDFEMVYFASTLLGASNPCYSL